MAIQYQRVDDEGHIRTRIYLWEEGNEAYKKTWI
jgi:hypothetical protein